MALKWEGERGFAGRIRDRIFLIDPQKKIGSKKLVILNQLNLWS